MKLLAQQTRKRKVFLIMDMKDFIDLCKKGNPISGEDKELHGLLTQCSYEAQKITMALIHPIISIFTIDKHFLLLKYLLRSYNDCLCL